MVTSFAENNDYCTKCLLVRTTNLVDQMVHMMEKYADHLEELVHERTELLELEQKRTEDLLCRMLPRYYYLLNSFTLFD
jgi:DNA integrity scanning protein DisA with diadenylate cyclase activity